MKNKNHELQEELDAKKARIQELERIAREVDRTFEAEKNRQAEMLLEQKVPLLKRQLKTARQKLGRWGKSIEKFKKVVRRVRKRHACSKTTIWRDVQQQKRFDKHRGKERTRARDQEIYKNDKKFGSWIITRFAKRIGKVIKREIKDYQGCVKYIDLLLCRLIADWSCLFAEWSLLRVDCVLCQFFFFSQ